MQILYLIGLGIITFGLILIGNKDLKQSIIYMLAIGGAVNANFYNAGNYPIYFFGYPFGIDSIIFTLFIFCCYVVAYFYNHKSSVTLLFSTMAAIAFSAVAQLVAQVASIGYTKEFMNTFITFMFSIIGSVVAVMAMLYLLKYLVKQKVNIYLNLLICMNVATILNSVIYYGLCAILNKGVGDDFILLLIPSLLGKIFAIGLSVITLFLLNCIEKRRNKSSNNELEIKES